MRKITELTDKEVQAVPENSNLNDDHDNNNNSPTQANLSAIVIPSKMMQNYNDAQMLDDSAVEIIHGVDNGRILPLSLNESHVDGMESAHNLSNNDRES